MKTKQSLQIHLEKTEQQLKAAKSGNFSERNKLVEHGYLMFLEKEVMLTKMALGKMLEKEQK